MRKWMRERLQRRKKTASEQSSQPTPPPLQPAYFDTDDAPADKTGTDQTGRRESEARPNSGESGDIDSPESKPRMAAREAAESRSSESSEEIATERAEQPRIQPPSGQRPSRQRSSGKDAQRGRGRRRRGGRGRGGRGREQAVAQAFAPTAGKGIIPEMAGDAGKAGASEIAEPATGEPETEIAAPVPEVPTTPAPAPAARPPKGIVVLAIGLPGSGKSSWFKRHNVVPLSSDMLRSLLFDDVREQRFQDLVFSNLRSMLKARLIAKRPMNYVDATNLTPQERQHWIKLAKDYNYEVHAVFFDVPLEVCIERHQRRDSVVPEDVMRRMAAKLKPPSFEEGFAKITVVRVKKKD
jgi:predicted kinase